MNWMIGIFIFLCVHQFILAAGVELCGSNELVGIEIISVGFSFFFFFNIG